MAPILLVRHPSYPYSTRPTHTAPVLPIQPPSSRHTARPPSAHRPRARALTRRPSSLVAHLSAATSFDVAFLRTPENAAIIAAARMFYITGFMVPVCLDALLLLAEHAAQHQKCFAMNLSAPFVSEHFYAPLMRVLPYADLVFGNETEAAAFAKAHGIPGDHLPDIVAAIARLPMHPGRARRRVVVITQGALPTIVSDGDTLCTFPVHPLVPPALIVDTNGAGDAFTGGFLAQVILNGGLARAVALGHEVAATIIRTSGVVYPAKERA